MFNQPKKKLVHIERHLQFFPATKRGLFLVLQLKEIQQNTNGANGSVPPGLPQTVTRPFCSPTETRLVRFFCGKIGVNHLDMTRNDFGIETNVIPFNLHPIHQHQTSSAQTAAVTVLKGAVRFRISFFFLLSISGSYGSVYGKVLIRLYYWHS